MKQIIIYFALLISTLSLIAMEEQDPIDPGMPHIVSSDYSDTTKAAFELKLEEQILFEPMVTGLSKKEKEFLKAAWRHNFTALQQKMEDGVSINTNSKNGCALHWALFGLNTNYAMLNFLLQKGIDVNLTTGSSSSTSSVLDFAISYMEYSYNPATEKEHFAQFLSALLAKKAVTTYEGKTLKDHLPAFEKHPELKAIVASHLK